jgi:glutaredoxin
MRTPVGRCSCAWTVAIDRRCVDGRAPPTNSTSAIARACQSTTRRIDTSHVALYGNSQRMIRMRRVTAYAASLARTPPIRRTLVAGLATGVNAVRSDAIRTDVVHQQGHAPTCSPQYTLFGYWRSGASWRVRIAMAYKGLAYTHRGVDLLASEQKSDEYAKLNPQRKVPLLVIDEKRSISQSLAIIDYLDVAHPETPNLLPKEPCQPDRDTNIARTVHMWTCAPCFRRLH